MSKPHPDPSQTSQPPKSDEHPLIQWWDYFTMHVSIANLSNTAIWRISSVAYKITDRDNELIRTKIAWPEMHGRFAVLNFINLVFFTSLNIEEGMRTFSKRGFYILNGLLNMLVFRYSWIIQQENTKRYSKANENLGDFIKKNFNWYGYEATLYTTELPVSLNYIYKITSHILCYLCQISALYQITKPFWQYKLGIKPFLQPSASSIKDSSEISVPFTAPQEHKLNIQKNPCSPPL